MKIRSSIGWITTIFAVLFSLPASYGQTDSLVLSSGTTTANGTISLNLTLTSPAGNEPAAAQWTLTFPASNVVSISATAGTSATNAGKTLYCSSGSGTYSCLASGMNANIISNGTLAVVNVTIASGVTSTSIALSNTMASSGSGSAITLSPTGGVVTGGGPTALVPTSLACLPTSLATSGTANCLLTLSGPAPVGGIAVAISSNNPLLTIPPSVTVSATATTATFTVTAGTIPGNQNAIVTATLNNTTQTSSLSLVPVLVSSIGCNPTSLGPNASSTCTVTLTAAAPTGGAVVTLTNTNTVLTVPGSVTVPAGLTSMTFNATTAGIGSDQSAIVTAAYNASSANTTVSLVAPVLVSSLTCNPTSLGSNATSVCTVTLTKVAPAGGALVTLTNTNPVLTVPTSVTVATGLTSVTFNATSGTVTAGQVVPITASLNGSSTIGSLGLQPTADTTPPSVSITAPTANGTVSNTITVTATASDNVAVADVQFQLNGVNVGADLTTAPYSISWDTATSSNGIHSLTAIARDTSHNAATSPVVQVMVSNTVTQAPTAGLIGYWNFDEGSGTIAHDTSTSGLNGVLSGASWTTGKINSGLSFSGTSGVVTPNITLGNTFSVSAWVNPAAVQGTYARIAETQYSPGFYLGTNEYGIRYKFIVNGAAGSTDTCFANYGCVEGGTLTSGWHLVTATFDGTTARLYVDSVQVASDTFTAPPNANFPLYIGRYYGASAYGWNGAIDEVRLYNRALTSADVSAIYTYTGGATPDTTPPTVSITSPIANTTVSNTITVTATASDNVAVADVQFQLDGVNVGADLTTPPYSISWNTVTASNGSHNLTAIATDTSHNAPTSVVVPVMVSNTVAQPPTAGLIGYWNFNEGSGTIAHDTSGSGYNGVVNGALWTAGKINSGLSFNGTSAVVTPNIALGNTFSVSAWVNPAAVQGTYARIAETQYSPGFYLGTNEYGIRYKLIVNGAAGSTGTCLVNYGCVEGGTVSSGWHLVTATFDGTTARLYVDSVLVASDTFTAPPNTNLPLYIGRYYGASAYGWNGIIDEVCLYNRALTSAEVTAIFVNTGAAPDTTPPSVSITSPIANTTVSNTVTVTATASDNVAVGDVQFQLDGVNLGADLTTAPYSISWNTATASNGSHNLTAIARDTSHNAATSAAVPVTVSNTVTQPPTAGLIGYWNFAKGSGTIAHDTSGSGYNGAISGASWIAGNINFGLSFSGTSGVVTPNITLGNTFSVSAWVNPAAVQGTYARIAETQYSPGFYLGTNEYGIRYKFIVNGAAGSTGTCMANYGCVEGGTVTSGWHLVTATFDGATARLYVDSVLAASDTFTAPPNTNLPLYIGRYYGASAYGWNGAIDEVRLYNRALSAAEVSALFN